MSQPPLDLLCIEPRYPGRLGAVADWLVRRRGYRVRFFCRNADPPAFWPEATGRGIEVVAFNVGGIAREPAVDWPLVLERGLCYSYGGWEVVDARRPRPIDLILGRSDGLGSTLFAPVTYPRTPIVQMFDSYFDPGRRRTDDEIRPEAYRHWRLAANAVELVDLENGVVPWVPTDYQRRLFPAEYRDDFFVLHDGVETRGLPPRNRAALTIAGRTIPAGARVATFVARSLDRLRGFDRFAEAADRWLREFPDLIAVALGAHLVEHSFDDEFYGRNYVEILQERTTILDSDRFWTPGKLPPDDVRRLLARSDLHLYPSRSHQASRSLVEAMASGCAVLGFDTEPTREFIEPGRTGLLAGDLDAAIRSGADVLRSVDARRTLGDAALDVVRERYARDVVMPRLVERFDRLVSDLPAPAPRG